MLLISSSGFDEIEKIYTHACMDTIKDLNSTLKSQQSQASRQCASCLSSDASASTLHQGGEK